MPRSKPSSIELDSGPAAKTFSESAGVSYLLTKRVALTVDAFYTPLSVRRTAGAPRTNDGPFNARVSLKLQSALTLVAKYLVSQIRQRILPVECATGTRFRAATVTRSSYQLWSPCENRMTVAALNLVPARQNTLPYLRN